VSASTLPLFPLPLVLFPGAPLPLHIFEPRYRQLLTDCLAGDRRFGIVFRPEGIEERELPPGHVGCVARIEQSETLPDGRSNVVVVGVERFALTRFVDSPHLYHIGEVQRYEDLVEPDEALAPAAERIRRLFARVGSAARTLADDANPLPDLPDDVGLLSFAIASLIDLDASARQRLLISRSPLGRLREIESLLAPAVEPIEVRATVHSRAKENGQGPHAPGAQS
jgi:Lon protease-like protein